MAQREKRGQEKAGQGSASAPADVVLEQKKLQYYSFNSLTFKSCTIYHGWFVSGLSSAWPFFFDDDAGNYLDLRTWTSKSTYLITEW